MYALGKKTVPGLAYQKKGSYSYKLPDTCSLAKDGVVSYKWQREEDFLTTYLIIKLYYSWPGADTGTMEELF